MCRASGVTKTCSGSATVSIGANDGLSFDSVKVHVSEVVTGNVREAGFGAADRVAMAGGGIAVPGALRDPGVDRVHATHARTTSHLITRCCLAQTVAVGLHRGARTSSWMADRH